MNLTKKIFTNRLILRKAKISDASLAYKNWMDDEEVTKFLRWKAHKNVLESEKVIKNWVDSYKNDDFFQWIIELKELAEPIGTISVISIDKSVNSCHIGYCIGKKFWNMGYTSEAFSAIISFLFSLGFDRIESSHDPNNPYSGKVMEKCGLIYEGRLRKADYNNQGIVDSCVYGILREGEQDLWQ